MGRLIWGLGVLLVGVVVAGAGRRLVDNATGNYRKGLTK